MNKFFSQLLEERDVTTAQVSRATGIPYNTLNDWRKGKTKRISYENAKKLGKYFNYPAVYFTEEKEVSEYQKRIKELYEVSAGCGRSCSCPEDYSLEDGELAVVVGDSMYPVLHDGDVVVIVPTTSVQPTDIALVKINGDENTLKYVEITRDGIWIRAENKDVFEDRFLTTQECLTLPVQIMGKAVEVRRKL